jgi:hypothetical protein
MVVRFGSVLEREKGEKIVSFQTQLKKLEEIGV